jgi:hypothetical protein
VFRYYLPFAKEHTNNMAKTPASIVYTGLGSLSSVLVLMTSPVAASLSAMSYMSSIWDDDKITCFLTEAQAGGVATVVMPGTCPHFISNFPVNVN